MSDFRTIMVARIDTREKIFLAFASEEATCRLSLAMGIVSLAVCDIKYRVS